jgi:hypothetical protein
MIKLLLDNQPPAEILRVQLEKYKADPRAPGLIINDVSVMRYLSERGGTLDIKQMLSAWRTQRATSKASVAPGTSSNADDGQLVSLERRGLRSVSITLVK